MATIDSIETRVKAFLSKPENSIFKWGLKDCALFANDMLVEVFNFKDVGAAFRGKYATDLGAAKTIFKNGYKSVPDIPDCHLTVVEMPQAGDVVLHPQLDALGVCAGEYSYFIQEHDGLKRVMNRDCRKAWRLICQQ